MLEPVGADVAVVELGTAVIVVTFDVLIAELGTSQTPSGATGDHWAAELVAGSEPGTVGTVDVVAFIEPALTFDV